MCGRRLQRDQAVRCFREPQVLDAFLSEENLRKGDALPLPLPEFLRVLEVSSPFVVNYVSLSIRGHIWYAHLAIRRLMFTHATDVEQKAASQGTVMSMPGGIAANTVKVLGKLGHAAIMIGKAGDDQVRKKHNRAPEVVFHMCVTTCA
eukprot:6086064-Pyramimonas_sp.AAC.1